MTQHYILRAFGQIKGLYLGPPLIYMRHGTHHACSGPRLLFHVPLRHMNVYTGKTKIPRSPVICGCELCSRDPGVGPPLSDQIEYVCLAVQPSHNFSLQAVLETVPPIPAALAVLVWISMWARPRPSLPVSRPCPTCARPSPAHASPVARTPPTPTHAPPNPHPPPPSPTQPPLVPRPPPALPHPSPPAHPPSVQITMTSALIQLERAQRKTSWANHTTTRPVQVCGRPRELRST